MTISKTDRPALILIDIQKGFDNIEYWGRERNNPDAENNARELLEHWRKDKLPIFHIQHCSKNPTSLLHENNKGNEFKDVVKPFNDEVIIKKDVNSAFIGTNLKGQLNDQQISKIVIVGLTTDHCVSTTARMAGNLGFDTFIVSDATATFDRKGLNGEYYTAELIHEITLASLNNEFAKIVKKIFLNNIFKYSIK